MCIRDRSLQMALQGPSSCLGWCTRRGPGYSPRLPTLLSLLRSGSITAPCRGPVNWTLLPTQCMLPSKRMESGHFSSSGRKFCIRCKPDGVGGSLVPEVRFLSVSLAIRSVRIQVLAALLLSPAFLPAQRPVPTPPPAPKPAIPAPAPRFVVVLDAAQDVYKRQL